MPFNRAGWKYHPWELQISLSCSSRQTSFFYRRPPCSKRQREKQRKTKAADSLHENAAASVIEYKRLSPDRSGSKPGIAHRAHAPSIPPPPRLFPVLVINHGPSSQHRRWDRAVGCSGSLGTHQRGRKGGQRYSKLGHWGVERVELHSALGFYWTLHRQIGLSVKSGSCCCRLEFLCEAAPFEILL